MKKVFALVLTIALAFCTVCACAEENGEYEELAKGSKGEAVTALQERLKELGYYTISIDGDYGNGTVKAIKAFQNRNSIPDTGIADNDTQTLLYSENAKHAPVLPSVRVIESSIDKNNQWIVTKLTNGLDEDIVSFYCMHITFGTDGEVICFQRLDHDENLLTHMWGIVETIKPGKTHTGQTPFPYSGLTAKCASGICMYTTASGRVVKYKPEQITFICSDGSIIYPLDETEPLVFKEGASENEKYGTSFSDEVLDFTWGDSEYIYITPWITKLYDLPNGAYIEDVAYDSVLYNNGIRSGDVIISINGHKWNDFVEYHKAIESYLNGEDVMLEYSRNRAVKTITLNITDSNIDLVADEIRKLGDLLNEGLLTQEEFDAQKEKLLGN